MLARDLSVIRKDRFVKEEPCVRDLRQYVAVLVRYVPEKDRNVLKVPHVRGRAQHVWIREVHVRMTALCVACRLSVAVKMRNARKAVRFVPETDRFVKTVRSAKASRLSLKKKHVRMPDKHAALKERYAMVERNAMASYPAARRRIHYVLVMVRVARIVLRVMVVIQYAAASERFAPAAKANVSTEHAAPALTLFATAREVNVSATIHSVQMVLFATIRPKTLIVALMIVVPPVIFALRRRINVSDRPYAVPRVSVQMA